MKTFVLFAVLSIAIAPPLYSQKYHTPDEMIKIMIDSKINYTLQVTSASLVGLETDNYRNNLTYPGLYIAEMGGDGGTALHSYDKQLSSDSVVFSLFHKAEGTFADGNTEKARELYEEVLDFYPENSLIMTYIGQTYRQEHKLEDAREWFEKAIETNRIDYMAHWFLADTYMDQREMEKAIRHIVIAHVLNRNNPRLQFSLERILQANGTPYDNWEFLPVYTLDTTTKGKVLITISNQEPDWMFYANCKALWAAEPGYAESVMDGSQQPRAMIEEKEALATLAIVAAKKEGDSPTFNESANRLISIIKDGHIDAFSLYEVIFRKNPDMAMMLPEDMFDIFQQYILTYHTKKE